ncbi:MAG: gamma-glutamyltransferase [Acidobacteria bacterium]|nr:gamma-glutamyltransferase [Acidobacteriota bacterium]
MTSHTGVVLFVAGMTFTVATVPQRAGSAAKPGAPLTGTDMVVSTTGKVEADSGSVSAEHPLATRAGLEMLQKGGNAVDAMIATVLALTVVKHGANGLGGYGGAMVIYRRDLPAPVVVDFNTRAPLAATHDMFYEKREDAITGIRSMTTWNTVAGLAVALERYGTMKWEEVIQPAIRYAEEGFVLESQYARALRSAYESKLHKWPASRAAFARPDGTFYEAGDRFAQKDLAASLRILAREGPDAIYTGGLARKMVDYLRSEGGIISMEDLANWRERHVRILKPAHVKYRGFDLYTSPINTGGQNLVAMLHLLNGFDLEKSGWSAQSVHFVLEAMKLSFADRLWYVGDPWTAKVPYGGLMSAAYAEERRKLIDPDVAWPYARPGDPWKHDQGGIAPFLTHPAQALDMMAPATVAELPAMLARNLPGMAPVGDTASTATMDKDGNMVALTMTMRDMLGGGVTVPGTGIALNNGMGLFHPTESDPVPAPNHPNRLEGGKLALNNMNPFVVLKDGQPYITGGGAGGRRIMSECLEVILNLLDWKMDVQDAVTGPRYHVEQKEPAAVERDFPYGLGKELEAKGHKLDSSAPWGSVHVIVRDLQTGKQHSAREPRQDVSAAGGLIAK